MMEKLFNLDSPWMRGLSKLADLAVLNIVALICCIPVVTIGASLTAMHYVLLKMARDEEGKILQSYFKSWKENFRQATILWLILLVLILILAGDVMILRYTQLDFPAVLKVLMIAAAIFVYMVSCYIFPVLARYENTIRNTVKNAFLMSVLSLPKTILMMVLYAVPVIILLIPMLMPLVLFFGFSAPAYLSAKLYSGTFKRFEPEEEEFSGEMEEAGDEEVQEVRGNTF